MRRGLRHATLGVALLSLAAGCLPPPAAPRPAAADEPTTDSGPSPVDLQPRLVSRPDADPRPPALRLLQQERFDLDVQDADLRTLLVGLIRHSPFNAVVSSDVQGSVTADLSNVTLFDLLEQIVEPRGFSYQIRGNTVEVARNPIETRTYYIDYPSYTRSGGSDFTAGGALSSSASSSSSSSSSSSGGSSSSSSSDSSSTTLRTANRQDFWTELQGSLQSLVFGSAQADAQQIASSGRQVLVAAQSGLVLIRAEHSVQDQVRSFLNEMTRSTQRQVLIDTRILEVSLSDDLDLGVDVEYAPDTGGVTRGVVGRLIGPVPPRTNPATLGSSLSPVLTNGGITFGLAGDHLAARLRALAAQTDVRVVSTPRIATLNNHQALIKVVRNQVFFIAENDVQIVEGVGTTVTTDFVPQVVPIGVTLDVTPRIGEDNQITLHIHPSVSEVVGLAAQPSTIPNVPSGSLPIVDLRETDTVVRVGDGDTIVMGGLIRSRELNQETKAPLLGDIPLLGFLFRGTNVEELRTELVILLTPKILDAPRIVEVASSSMDSVDQLNALRLERRPMRQWWRTPRNQSYGVP
jgi:MSHA biogenesis protein MshL